MNAIQQIVARTERRLDTMAPVRAPRFLGPPADKALVNEEIRAANAAREQVAEDAISAILAEWPTGWPKWEQGLYNTKESEFIGMTAIIERIASVDRSYAK